MNLELIKQYKKEFNHLVDGGKLLAILDGPDEDWFTVTTDTKIFSAAYGRDIKGIVINDKYVEFRKALIEGKIVQWNHSDYDQSESQWVTIDGIDTSYDLSRYRIKPEEPKFKVGDWLRVKKNGYIFSLKPLHLEKGLFYYNNVLELNEYLEESEVIKWEPQKGELCWFTDNRDIGRAELSIFSHINFTPDDMRFTTSNSVLWKHCEPFLNTKPSWFKEIK